MWKCLTELFMEQQRNGDNLT